VEAYKFGEAVGYKVMPTVWYHRKEGIRLPETAPEIRLQLAECAAFGGSPGVNWALRPKEKGTRFAIDDKALAAATGDYLNFFAQHPEIFLGSRTVTEVAMLYSFPSITFNYQKSYLPFLCMEQVLVQRRVPFDVVFAEEIGKIKNYRLVILPNVVCLSDDEAKLLLEFVKSGGTLYITGECGESDENFRERKNGVLESLRKHPRVTWRPEIPEMVDMPRLDVPKVPLSPQADNIVSEMEELLKNENMIKVKAPEMVAADLRRSGSGVLCVHVVNYRNDRNAKGINVTLRKDLSAGMVAHYFSPDDSTAKGGKVVAQVKSGSNCRYSLPSLATYGILVLTKE